MTKQSILSGTLNDKFLVPRNTKENRDSYLRMYPLIHIMENRLWGFQTVRECLVGVVWAIPASQSRVSDTISGEVVRKQFKEISRTKAFMIMLEHNLDPGLIDKCRSKYGNQTA